MNMSILALLISAVFADKGIEFAVWVNTEFICFPQTILAKRLAYHYLILDNVKIVKFASTAQYICNVLYHHKFSKYSQATMTITKSVHCTLFLAVLLTSINCSHLTSTSTPQIIPQKIPWGNFVLGPILILFAFPCIWYNEKRAAVDASRLNTARQICIELDPNEQPDGSEQGKLVFMTGETVNIEDVFDQVTGARASNAIKIRRHVEVKEWRSVKRGNNTEDFTLDWRTSNEANVSGHYNDPSNWFINEEVIPGRAVMFGGFKLSEEQIKNCSKSIQLPATNDNISRIMSYFPALGRQPQLIGNYIYFSRSGNPEEEGALRVSFSYTPTGPLSIMCQTAPGYSFQPFPIAQYNARLLGKQVTKNDPPGCCCCAISNCVAEVLKPIEQIDLLEEERLSKHGIVDMAQSRSDCCSKILRIVSFLMMVCGLAMFFSPLTAMLGYIPLLGGILQGTANVLIFIACLLVCLPLYLLVLSIAWLFYHPKVGIPLLTLGIIGVGILIWISIKRPPHPVAIPGYPSALPAGPALYNTPIPYYPPPPHHHHLSHNFHQNMFASI